MRLTHFMRGDRCNRYRAFRRRQCPHSATSIDLSTWSCAKFQSADKDDIGVILAWMDGYYRGEDDPPVIDTEKFIANAKETRANTAPPILRPASSPPRTSFLPNSGRDRQATRSGKSTRFQATH